MKYLTGRSRTLTIDGTLTTVREVCEIDPETEGTFDAQGRAVQARAFYEILPDGQRLTDYSQIPEVQAQLRQAQESIRKAFLLRIERALGVEGRQKAEKDGFAYGFETVKEDALKLVQARHYSIFCVECLRHFRSGITDYLNDKLKANLIRELHGDTMIPCPICGGSQRVMVHREEDVLWADSPQSSASCVWSVSHVRREWRGVQGGIGTQATRRGHACGSQGAQSYARPGGAAIADVPGDPFPDGRRRIRSVKCPLKSSR